MNLFYDPLGRLWQVTGGPVVDMQFVSDGDHLAIEYRISSGAVERRYVHGSGVDEPLVQYDGAGLTVKRHLHADHQGSIIAKTDAAGANPAINRYDEFGIPQSTNSGRFGYTGQLWLKEIGLNHYKARMYSPPLGRFLQVDPVGYDDGFNLYAYVGGDPLNRIDPSGARDIYIGGLFDKNGTRLVQDFVERQRLNHPGRDIQYFSHIQDAAISTAINAPLGENEPLNIVGHSLGGSEAIRQAAGTDALITNLITIDPIGKTGDVGRLENVGAWANVRSVPSDMNGSDLIAATGNFIWPDSDASGADLHLDSKFSHGSFGPIMDQINATDAVNQSYRECATTNVC